MKYLRLDEQNETVAITDLGFQPTFDVRNLPAMGQFTVGGVNVGAANLKLNRQNYSRDEVKAAVSQYLDLKGMSHQLKAGFGVEGTKEDLTRQSNGWGLVSIVQAGRQVQARYYPRQPSQLSKSRTYSLFFQDNVTIGPRLVINAGVLFNQDDFRQELDSTNTFLTFGMGSQIQPRLGANYNLRKGAGDKIYGNYGRYYNSDQKSSARSLAPNRLFTNDALFDSVTGALISDTQGANTTGKVLRQLDPTYTDEALFGYATPLAGGWSVDAFFLYRTSNDFIEDQPTALPASTFVVDNLSNAFRKYRAFTVELSRPLRDKWSLTASYALTRLWGNFDLDYSTVAVFNTSSILQDGPGVFVEDRFREGPLSQDRTHVLKIFGHVRADAAPHVRRLPARAERAAVGGARPRLVRRLPALHGAGWQQPQRRLDELRRPGRLQAAGGRQDERDVRGPRPQPVQPGDGARARQPPVPRRPHPHARRHPGRGGSGELHRRHGGRHDAAEPALRRADALRRAASTAGDGQDRLLRLRTPRAGRRRDAPSVAHSSRPAQGAVRGRA